MLRRHVGCALAWIALTVPFADAQSPSRSRWAAPRTTDGQPDLQGVWTNATITPLERPAALKGKAFLTEAEALAFEEQAAKRREEADRPIPGRFESYNQFWLDGGTTVLSTRQTSLVVDPPDGRVPVRPEAERTRDYNLAHYGDNPEHMSPWDRCITRGMPGGMLPAGYNNAYQIMQFPGYVVIHYEMIHEARIIPIDGRPASPTQVRSWNGEPRGRWDGDTLVVETTNYNSLGAIATSQAGGRIKGIPHTDRLHVVERFQRTAPDTISYSATIVDPDIYTAAWTVSFPLTADPQYRIYEYACHEGNYAVENMLRGARAQDAAPNKKD